MAANINRVVLVGNLTRDPEMKHLPSGTALCSLRIAVNTRRKDETGQWTDKPNYFDVSVWGNQGESCAQYLAKGRPVAIDGRLEWREWEATDGSGKRRQSRSSPDNVQFLGGRNDGDGGGGGGQFVPAGASAVERCRLPSQPADDDIPSRRSEDMAQKAPARKRPSSSSAPGRRKSCHFCKDKITEVDYKNVNQLRRYISEKGKIRNRRITGACRRHQRQVAVAVKRAREVALLPYVAS
jgi:single-strand DNA-binding protein